MSFSEERLEAARGYLSDYLSDEDCHGDDSTEWFDAHVASLPLEDPRIAESAQYLKPFLDDDSRIDCAMYPAGAAVGYIEDAGWGGDFDSYLTGFVGAIGQDWRSWQDLIAVHGESAEWRLDTQ